MNATILHTEDCPNLEPLLAELRSVIDGRHHRDDHRRPLRRRRHAPRLTWLADHPHRRQRPLPRVRRTRRTLLPELPLLCRPWRTCSRIPNPGKACRGAALTS